MISSGVKTGITAYCVARARHSAGGDHDHIAPCRATNSGVASRPVTISTPAFLQAFSR